MKIKVGNLFESKDEYIFVTGNSYIKKNGELVMGRGAAKELVEIFPLIQDFCGEIIMRNYGHLGEYGIVYSKVFKYGVFQVKTHFLNDASLYLISNSVDKMIKDTYLSYYTISMNFPGIGNGRLRAGDVFPFIEKLDDNVTVYIRSLEDLR